MCYPVRPASSGFLDTWIIARTKKMAKDEGATVKIYRFEDHETFDNSSCELFKTNFDLRFDSRGLHLEVKTPGLSVRRIPLSAR